MGRDLESEKKLSIIIPVYNTAGYLKKCLDSVLESIDDRMEILIINDGSTDNSEDIILSYCHNKSIRYLKKENGGLADVKNYALSRAKGEYIIFLDSDDYIDKEMYKEMLDLAINNNYDLVICDFCIVHSNNRMQYVRCNNPNRDSKLFQILDTPLMASSNNKIVKIDLYKGLSFPKGMNNEDVSVTPILLANANDIGIINKPFYNYYQREGSIQKRGLRDRFIIIITSRIAIDYSEDLSFDIKEKIKGSLYVHQVMAVLIYLILQEKNFFKKYFLVRDYVNLIHYYLPDLLENKYVKERLDSVDKYERTYNTLLSKLLQSKMYFIACSVDTMYKNNKYKPYFPKIFDSKVFKKIKCFNNIED